MSKPKNITAKEGSSVDLDCQAEGYPNNITYRWYKNGIDVQSIPELMTRAQIDKGKCFGTPTYLFVFGLIYLVSYFELGCYVLGVLCLGCYVYFKRNSG